MKNPTITNLFISFVSNPFQIPYLKKLNLNELIAYQINKWTKLLSFEPSIYQVFPYSLYVSNFLKCFLKTFVLLFNYKIFTA
jgi:hypothetical protein